MLSPSAQGGHHGAHCWVVSQILRKEVMQRQLPLSVGGLRGQGVEQCSCSEAFVSSLDPQLFLFDHMHERDPNESILGCLERFEPQHGPCHPFDCAMILLHHVVEVFHLTDDDIGAVFLVVALDRGFIGVAAVNGNRLGKPVAAARLLQKPPRGLFIPMRGEQNVTGLAVFVHRPIQIAPLAFALDIVR
jgi:hypothetical protein